LSPSSSALGRQRKLPLDVAACLFPARLSDRYVSGHHREPTKAPARTIRLGRRRLALAVAVLWDDGSRVSAAIGCLASVRWREKMACRRRREQLGRLRSGGRRAFLGNLLLRRLAATAQRFPGYLDDPQDRLAIPHGCLRCRGSRFLVAVGASRGMFLVRCGGAG